MAKEEDEVTSILNRAGVEFFSFVDANSYDELATPGHRVSDLLSVARSALVYILPVSRDVVEKFPRSYSGESYERYVEEKISTARRLREIGRLLVNRFRESRFDATLVPAGSKQYMGPVSLRHLGYYAGLGIFGRSSLLLNPVHGPCFRIGAVVTSYRPSGFGNVIDLGTACEDCNECIANCPAGALGVPRTGEKYRFSAQKCHEYFCKMRGIGLVIENANVNCGLCRQVCPIGK